MADPLRLMVYDDTCRGKPGRVGLTHSWIAGALLYRGLGRLDAWCGVTSWRAGLEFLATHAPDRPIGEVQFWGHGKWGEARVQNERLDEGILSPEHPLFLLLDEVRDRLTADALWWFRTCETFGAHRGQAFAVALSEQLDCRVAGHTYIIGPWQSGLHSLRPGDRPQWSPHEGLAQGEKPAAPRRALWSRPFRPNTITCLHSHVPAGF